MVLGVDGILSLLFSISFVLRLHSSESHIQGAQKEFARFLVQLSLFEIKMGKGLLRGLKYISQIFEDEKEPEMEIGFPTDVKHVAHIGCEGPSSSTPSWMNEFKSPPEVLNRPSNPPAEVKNPSTNLPAEDCSQSEKVKTRTRRPPSVATGSPSSSPARKSSTDAPRHSRRQTSGGTGSPSSSPRGSDAPKHSRRRRSVSNMSMDSPDRDSSVSSRSSKHGVESPAREQPAIPKHSRGRKSKGSSSGGSSKSSRSKDRNSVADAIATENESHESEPRKGRTNTATQVTSVLEAHEDER